MSIRRVSTGVYLRWLCQLVFSMYIVYFLIVGSNQIANKEKTMGGVFICSINNNNRNNNGSDGSSSTTTTQTTIEMTQCTGLDDTTTCSSSSETSGGGGGECIQSSCGRKLFPNIGISYAGTSNPWMKNAPAQARYRTTTTLSSSTTMTIAIGYSLTCPYLISIYYICTFLTCGNVIVLSRLGMIVFTSLFNNVLLKHVFHQYRPYGSCLYFDSYGMPR